MGLLLVDDEPGGRLTGPAGRCWPTWPARPGAAVHGVRLTASLRAAAEQLQTARERLVVAGEEERRRLRRNLHDELAPDPGRGRPDRRDRRRPARPRPDGRRARVLDRLQRSLRAAVGDIRRLVDELRPVLLDERGLVGAIRERADGAGGRSSTSRSRRPAPLPELPAAVEVAAYRICQEALMNVLKHAARADVPRAAGGRRTGPRAGRRGRRRGRPGADRRAGPGVGLASMRERAAELGGTLHRRRPAGRGHAGRRPPAAAPGPEG